MDASFQAPERNGFRYPLFRRNDRQNFGSFTTAIMSTWRIETLDGWEEMMCKSARDA